ncbi:MAG: DUF1294 domain-containing protein [Muribaculaceae bacterium]|nr:DUF1294 domain-containing protein [Muribaculaceae bacterium]
MNESIGWHIVVMYLVVINVVAFVAYGIDKWKARHGRWRIREAMLLGVAVLGGSVGAWAGMLVWRHKTRHVKFRYGIPLIVAVQVVLLLLTACRARREAAPVATVERGSVQEHSPSVLLVLYDPEVGKDPLLKAIRQCGAHIVYDYNMMPGMAIKKPDDKTLEETMQYFRTVKGVVNVEYDHIYRLTDPVRPRQER